VLDVALQFSKMVNGGVLYARNEVSSWGKTSYDHLPVCPDPDPEFAGWANRTREELRTKLVSANIWPDMATVHREYGSLIHKLQDEYGRAISSQGVASDRDEKPKARRKRLPPKVEADVLVASRRRCCICFGLHRDIRVQKGQIAHLDGDPGNDNPDNLAFLCQAHHDEYDRPSSQCKGLTVEEVKEYRSELYDHLSRMEPRETGGEDPAPARGPVVIEFPGSPSQTNASGDNIIAGGDVSINRHVVRKNVVTPGPEHIAGPVAKRIKDLIDEIAAIDKETGHGETHRRWWTKFYRALDVTSYHLIPVERGEVAIAWLERQRAMQRPKLRRTNNEAWRKQHYTAIYARAKQIGLDKEQLYAIALERLPLKSPITSLKELGEQNLEKLHRIIFGMGVG
jgi:hypothetical protein